MCAGSPRGVLRECACRTAHALTTLVVRVADGGREPPPRTTGGVREEEQFFCCGKQILIERVFIK